MSGKANGGKSSFKSFGRAVRRGHISSKLNHMTGFIEFYRRTATSKMHSIFVGQVDVNGQDGINLRG